MPGESLIRYRVIRVADTQDDRKTVLQIVAAPATDTQEHFQEFVLSQINRAIWGDTWTAHHWYEDFAGAGVRSLRDLTDRQNAVVVGETLAGAINGTNTVFATADKFLHAVGGESIRVYLNGQRLALTDDFTLSESGGPATGYDTVTLVAAPRVGDKLRVDYTKR